MQLWGTAKPRLIGTVKCKLRKEVQRDLKGQTHLSVQFLLTPEGGCGRKAEELFRLCSSSMPQMGSNLRRPWWLLQAGRLGCKSLSQQGHRVSQCRARNSAQDQHGCVELETTGSPLFPTLAREPSSGPCFSTVRAMNFSDKA